MYVNLYENHFSFIKDIKSYSNCFVCTKCDKNKSYDVRSKDILEELSWQPLMERWGNNKAIFMHKVTIIIYEIIISIIKYKLEKPKTNFQKKSISFSGAKTWNELPVELKSNCLSLNAFKTLLRDRS